MLIARQKNIIITKKVKSLELYNLLDDLQKAKNLTYSALIVREQQTSGILDCRKAYQSVCSSIQSMKEVGSTVEAENLRNDLLQIYAKRRIFVDELQKIISMIENR